MVCSMHLLLQQALLVRDCCESNNPIECGICYHMLELKFFNREITSLNAGVIGDTKGISWLD